MNNGYQFPNAYQSQFYNQNSIIWVTGIEGAHAWQMHPNTSAVLMDKDNDGIFYIKTCDNIGMCNLRVFRYQEVVDKPTQPDMSEYVKKSELETLINSLLGGKNEQSVSTANAKQSTANK